MNVKIIGADDRFELEDEINLFLQTIPEHIIFDIKYQGVGSHPPHGVDRLSAMIILKGDKKC